MDSIGSSCFEMSSVCYRITIFFSMEDFMDVYWSSRNIVQGGLFHVIGHLDQFDRYLFVGQN